MSILPARKRGTWRARALFVVLVSFAVVTLGTEVAAAKSAKVTRLEALLEDKYEKVRIKAALALSKLGDKDAVPALISALTRDKSSEVRASVAVALGNIGDLRAKAALTKAKRDKDATVRSVASKALAKLKPAAGPRLLKKAYYVEWDKVVNKSTVRDAELAELYKSVLTAKLRKFGSDFLWERGKSPHGLSLQGTIKKISKIRIDGMTAVEMKVSLVVKTLPGNALVTVAEAEAAVALGGTITAKEEKELRRDALKAALDETFDLFVRALRVRP